MGRCARRAGRGGRRHRHARRRAARPARCCPPENWPCKRLALHALRRPPMEESELSGGSISVTAAKSSFAAPLLSRLSTPPPLPPLSPPVLHRPGTWRWWLHTPGHQGATCNNRARERASGLDAVHGRGDGLALAAGCRRQKYHRCGTPVLRCAYGLAAPLWRSTGGRAWKRGSRSSLVGGAAKRRLVGPAACDAAAHRHTRRRALRVGASPPWALAARSASLQGNLQPTPQGSVKFKAAPVCSIANHHPPHTPRPL